MEDPRKSKRPPDQTVFGLKLGQDYPRIEETKEMAEWAPEDAKPQAARRNGGIYEVLTEDKDYFKVIADARLKLEKDTSPAVPFILREDNRGKPQAGTTSIDAGEEQSYSEKTGSSGKVKRRQMDHIAEKCMWEASTMAQYTRQFLFKKLWRYQEPKPQRKKNGKN